MPRRSNSDGFAIRRNSNRKSRIISRRFAINDPSEPFPDEACVGILHVIYSHVSRTNSISIVTIRSDDEGRAICGKSHVHPKLIVRRLAFDVLANPFPARIISMLSLHQAIHHHVPRALAVSIIAVRADGQCRSIRRERNGSPGPISGSLAIDVPTKPLPARLPATLLHAQPIHSYVSRALSVLPIIDGGSDGYDIAIGGEIHRFSRVITDRFALDVPSEPFPARIGSFAIHAVNPHATAAFAIGIGPHRQRSAVRGKRDGYSRHVAIILSSDVPSNLRPRRRRTVAAILQRINSRVSGSVPPVEIPRGTDRQNLSIGR
mmetsp:Transcript_31409/g.65743  ORF Transcript_31409/g.65743 Transcript_31409/m.65743 type:complete len:319 (+) Transcript_31409:1304-2260(+)